MHFILRQLLNIKNYILKKLGWLAHPHKKRLILTLIVTYFLGLAFIAIFYEGQFLSIRYLSQNEIFWTMTFLWTAAWIAALISGRFTRIRNGLGILLGIWSYLPDRMPAIDLLGQVGNAAVQELIKAMKNGEPTVRATAAEILGKIKDVQTVPHLTLAMKNDKCIDVRIAAVESLGQIGDVQAVPDLILVLKDNNPYSEIRPVAARALGQIGDVQAVPDLIQMLKDGDSSICEAAAEALGQIGDVRAVPDLIQLLEKDKTFASEPAAIALGRIGDPQAIPPLIREMDKYSSFSSVASEALGQIGLPAMPFLFEKLMWSDKYVRDNAASALRHIFKEVHEQIEANPVKALNNGNWLLRWCVVAGVFGKIKDLRLLAIFYG